MISCDAIWRDPADVVLECVHVLWVSALYCVILKKEAPLLASKREVSAILSADGYSDTHLKGGRKVTRGCLASCELDGFVHHVTDYRSSFERFSLI